MTSRGVDFLEGWVAAKLPPMPVGDAELVKRLAQTLRDAARAAGFALDDLELEDAQVEPFIRETLLHIAEPGTPGD